MSAVMPDLNTALFAGAVFSAIASLLHIGCILGGAAWYDFFGAGTRMVQWSRQGLLYPTLITAVIAIVLAAWCLLALAGAGLLPRLPLLTPALCIITAVYLIRGLGGFLLICHPLGRSRAFWFWSSAICLVIGSVHLIGIIQQWSYLLNLSL